MKKRGSVKAKYFAAIASVIEAIVFIAPAQAFLTFSSPLRVGFIDWGRDKPESQANTTLLVPYFSGSVLRKNGKDVNVPVPCKTKSCRHVELQDPKPISPPLSVSGYRYEWGKDNMVPGGFGPLAAVNGGKEPTGFKVFEFNKDYEGEFKVILIKVVEGNEPKAVFEAFFRACIRNPVTKKWLTCTPYFIPSGITETISLDQDPPRSFPVEVNTSYKNNPIKRPQSVINQQQALLAASGLLPKPGGGTGGSASSGSGSMSGTSLSNIQGVSGTQVGTPNFVTNKRETIVYYALKYQNYDSSAGPDGGRNACAWMVNKVLLAATGSTIGALPNYVPSVEEALIAGKGYRIPLSQAKPGDIIISKGQAHIGVCMANGCSNVLSNSSSKAKFSWQSDPNFGGTYDKYGGSSVVYRIK
jgi:hypothetical protein